MPAGNGKQFMAVRLGAMGDVVLTTGVLGHWQRKYGYSFAVLTRRAFAPVFIGHPAVSEVVTLPEDRPSLAGWIRFCRDIARRFSASGLIDLHGNLRTRILRALWPGETFSYPKFGLDRRLFLFNRSAGARERLRSRNVTQRYALALDSHAPGKEELLPRLFPSSEEVGQAAEILEEAGIRRPFAVLHPYAVHPGKMWPAGHWAELNKGLEASGIDRVIVGVGEKELFSPGKGCLDLTGKTDLRTCAAIISLAGAFAGNDSGPMHLAASVGTPIAAFFGPTSQEWGFYPAGKRDVVLETDLPCRPCALHGNAKCRYGYPCLNGIKPGNVFEVINGLLRNK